MHMLAEALYMFVFVLYSGDYKSWSVHVSWSGLIVFIYITNMINAYLKCFFLDAEVHTTAQ